MYRFDFLLYLVDFRHCAPNYRRKARYQSNPSVKIVLDKSMLAKIKCTL